MEQLDTACGLVNQGAFDPKHMREVRRRARLYFEARSEALEQDMWFIVIYLRTVVLLSFVFVENAVRAFSAHHGSETLNPIGLSLFLEKQKVWFDRPGR